MPTSTHACCLAVALASILSCAPAMAGSIYDVTVQQVGNDVVFTGNGSVDLTGLTDTHITASDGSGGVDGLYSVLSVGASNSFTLYSGLSGSSAPDLFGTGTYSSSSDTGPFFDVQGVGGDLALPAGYMSGTALGTSTSTFDNTTIAGLGLIPGTYNWTWANGDITLTIPSVPVPEPATLALLGLPLATLLLARRDRPMSR